MKIYLNTPKAKRKFLDTIAAKLGIEQQEDWYHFGPNSLQQLGEKKIVERLRNSLSTHVISAYKEFLWFPWMFNKCPPNYWQHLPNRRFYLDWLAERLNIECQYDWYSVSTEDIKENYGSGILTATGSIYNSLRTTYPEFEWCMWLFDNSSNRTWMTLQTHKDFFDWLACELGIRYYEEWYALKQDFEQYYDRGLLSHYKNSYLTALESVYSQYQWHAWLFPQVPPLFWEDINKRKQFVEWFECQVGISKPSDWYRIKASDIIKMGGKVILHDYYGRSIKNMLTELKPEYKWYQFLFRQTPQSYWHSMENQKEFLEWIAAKVKIKKPEHWYKKVTQTVLRRYGGRGLLQFYDNSLSQTYQAVFPQYDWLELERISNKQMVAWNVLKQFRQDAQLNYKHPQLLHMSSQKNMELDIYIPSLKLAFEYQGAQHYKSSYRFDHPYQMRRDQEKQTACEQLGITLLTIPYWWDGSRKSLITTILKQCPEMKEHFVVENKE